jgi:hypothetical protein
VNLTDEEKDERDAHVVALAAKRAALNVAIAEYNATVASAHLALMDHAARYDAALASATEFCDRVAQPRLKYEDTRPQRQYDVRDMGETWFDGGIEMGEMTAGIGDCPREIPNDDAVEDILRDLPTERR